MEQAIIKIRVAALLALTACALAGCRAEKIERQYGRRYGPGAALSVNGTNVLAAMFELAGHRVVSRRQLPELPMQLSADCIVWFPDDFDPPRAEVWRWFERWLATGYGRTLIYVGRYYDAEIWYWKFVQSQAPPEQAEEIQRRLEWAERLFGWELENAREFPEEYWFGFQSIDGPRNVRTLQGDPRWLEGINPARTEIQLHKRLVVRTPADVLLRSAEYVLVARREIEFSAEYLLPHEFNSTWSEPEKRYPQRSRATGQATRELRFQPIQPPGIRTPDVLWSQDDTLEEEDDIEESRDPYRFQRGDFFGQWIVVANGSFLLNLPLVNQEHRKLAGRLIEEIGPPGRRVVFLESHPGGPPIASGASRRPPTGLDMLLISPFCWLFLQLAVLGALVCLWRWPIFGLPRTVHRDDASDFGRHIDALGELLRRSGDHSYARSRLIHYQQAVRPEGKKS